MLALELTGSFDALAAVIALRAVLFVLAAVHAQLVIVAVFQALAT